MKTRWNTWAPSWKSSLSPNAAEFGNNLLGATEDTPSISQHPAHSCQSSNNFPTASESKHPSFSSLFDLLSVHSQTPFPSFFVFPGLCFSDRVLLQLQLALNLRSSCLGLLSTCTSTPYSSLLTLILPPIYGGNRSKQMMPASWVLQYLRALLGQHHWQQVKDFLSHCP